eukprot:2034624-Rhodomonas_salina.1
MRSPALTCCMQPLTFALDPTASAGPPPVSNLLSVVGFGCPGQHTPVFEAAQEGGVCSVCTRATLPGERQVASTLLPAVPRQCSAVFGVSAAMYGVSAAIYDSTTAISRRSTARSGDDADVSARS